MIAPAIGAAKPTSPTTSTCRTSPTTRTVVVSPIARPDRSSAEVSRAISPAPAGSRPSAIHMACSSGCSAMPKLGGPELMTAVPSAPTSTIGPLTSGTAPATPSVAASTSAISRGNDSFVPPLMGSTPAVSSTPWT